MKEDNKKIKSDAKGYNPNNEENSAECNDKHCPVHGTLSVRGRAFVERVVSTKTHRTATVITEIKRNIKKYERYEKRRKKLHVHNPDCINAKKGDLVKIMECRPISKTKNFVIIEKVKEK